MIINNIKHFLFAGMVGCGLAAATTACTDTWDDHYEGTAMGVAEGSLWEAIKANPELSNFASVIEAVGYDKNLASSQVFTVFAPVNAKFSETEAKAMIDRYNEERKTVSEEDNTVLKEFVQNHIALYNHSVSKATQDTIVMMNGKYAVLDSAKISGVKMLTTNDLYGNGVLFTLDDQVVYNPNIFEYIRKDADLDSVESFMYNPKFYFKEFQPGQSVAGGLDSLGTTVYLDSVFKQRNRLWTAFGNINEEDSTYWMLLPTNTVWDQLVTEYEKYFQYSSKVENRDSLTYTNSRIGILYGTVFSKTMNKAVFNQEKVSGVVEDSLISENCIINYDLRPTAWGHYFNYGEYYNVWQPGGVFAQNEVVECSNGQVRKCSTWPIDKLQTFLQYRVIEADGGYIWDISKTTNLRGDSIQTVIPTQRMVTADTVDNYYPKVWNHSFVEFIPQEENEDHKVTFALTDILSNIGYDIYLVTAPATAYNKNATAFERLPTTLDATLSYPDAEGKTKEKYIDDLIDTNPNGMDYVKLFDNMEFPVSNYGVAESVPSITLMIKTDVLNSDIADFVYNRIMRIDCILLVPHGTFDPDAVYEGLSAVKMTPHGAGQPWEHYMLR